MKIGIVGSRGYPEWGRVWNYVFSLPPGSQIVSGGCPNSPDVWAVAAAQQRQEWWKDLEKPIIFPIVQAPGETLGFAAYRRNAQIVECGIEKLVAFWTGDVNASRGTRNTIQLADRRAIPVEVYLPSHIESVDPKEQCRMDIFLAAAMGTDGMFETAGILLEKLLDKLIKDGYTERQIVWSVNNMASEKAITLDAGIIYLTGLKPTVELPCKPVYIDRVEALSPAQAQSPQKAISAQETGVQMSAPDKDLPVFESAERISDDEEAALIDALSKMPTEQKRALKAIADFEKSKQSADDEEANWEWDEEYPYDFVTVRHYHPNKGEVESVTYHFTEGRCSCPRQEFIRVPCKHSVARERKIIAYNEAKKLQILGRAV